MVTRETGDVTTGLPMSLVESVEGCGFDEFPENWLVLHIALGGFKEL